MASSSSPEGNRSFVDVVTNGLDKTPDPNDKMANDSDMKEGEEEDLEHTPDDEFVDWETDSEKDEEESEDTLCPTITLSKEEKGRLRKPWSSSVIIRLLGMQMGYGALSRRLRAMWKPSGTLDIIDVGNDYYIAKFGAMTDFRKVLMEGPWIVADHYLTVQQWKPDFDPTSTELNNLVVWVRFPDAPIEYFDRNFLFKRGGR